MGKLFQVVSTLANSALLMYHIWLERTIGRDDGGGGSGVYPPPGSDPGVSDPGV